MFDITDARCDHEVHGEDKLSEIYCQGIVCILSVFVTNVYHDTRSKESKKKSTGSFN